MSETSEGEDVTPLGGLPAEEPPPPGLEDRVVARLAASVGFRRRSAVRRWLPLAASLIGLLAGWTLRGLPREVAPAAAPDAALFLLLLSDDPAEGPPESERIRIYTAWARELAAAGKLESARKLDDRGAVLAAGATGPADPLLSDAATPSGYFLVKAASLEEAVEIARQSPHARLGGRVTVRPIDPV